MCVLHKQFKISSTLKLQSRKTWAGLDRNNNGPQRLPWCPVLLQWCPLQGFPHRSTPHQKKIAVPLQEPSSRPTYTSYVGDWSGSFKMLLTYFDIISDNNCVWQDTAVTVSKKEILSPYTQNHYLQQFQPNFFILNRFDKKYSPLGWDIFKTLPQNLRNPTKQKDATGAGQRKKKNAECLRWNSSLTLCLSPVCFWRD